jgi:hypothetical protein
MTEEEIAKEVKNIPHYKEPYIYKGFTIGYPFDLTVALSSWGKDIIPSEQGIYHLFYKGNLVYIGMSKSLRGRLLYHVNDVDKVFDAVLWFTMKDKSLEDILTIETNMIKKFTPALNISCITIGY